MMIQTPDLKQKLDAFCHEVGVDIVLKTHETSCGFTRCQVCLGNYEFSSFSADSKSEAENEVCLKVLSLLVSYTNT